jgi:hypothetical protein
MFPRDDMLPMDHCSLPIFPKKYPDLVTDTMSHDLPTTHLGPQKQTLLISIMFGYMVGRLLSRVGAYADRI